MLLPYSTSSGALESLDLLLPYSVITIELHITIILIITNPFIFLSFNQINGHSYYFRAQVIDTDNHNAPGVVSEVVFARTTPAFDPVDGADTVSMDGILPEDRLAEDTTVTMKQGKKTGT
jgi:hypothetical protein